MNELVNKLRKAGIKASLVHRIQDETMITIEDVADTVQATREIANLLIQGSGVGYEVIGDTLREKRQVPMEANFARWYANREHTTTPNGGRRDLRK